MYLQTVHGYFALNQKTLESNGSAPKVSAHVNYLTEHGKVLSLAPYRV